jgi:hypothetical protein
MAFQKRNTVIFIKIIGGIIRALKKEKPIKIGFFDRFINFIFSWFG